MSPRMSLKGAALRIGAVLVALASGLVLPGYAAASLIGQEITIVFQEPGFPDEIDLVTVGAGPEIVAGDGSSIGDIIFLAGESLDVGAESIRYQIRGDGPAHATPGFFTTGFDPEARFVFSGLSWADMPGRIVGVNITLDNVVGVALGSEVFFSDDSVTLVIGTLGVGELAGGPDVGMIQLDLQVEHVPEPATLGLGLLAAIGGLLARRR